MVEIIDLSQEIFSGMPVYKSLPEVRMEMYASHEEWDGITDSITVSPSVYKLDMSEHTGTHVDSLSHMAPEFKGQSIDTMPLSMFYTEGICLDLSHKGLMELIEPADLVLACSKGNLTIKRGDTVLVHTDHYRRTYGSADWGRGPGLSVAATQWLGEQGISAFGVE
ncbi:MAG: cyclase family protein, partial [Arenibacter sp.]